MYDNEQVMDGQETQVQPESIESQDEYQDNTLDQQEKKSSSKDENIRAIREKMERLERERNDYARAYQEMEMWRQSQLHAQQKPQEVELPDIDPSDEDLLEGKHYKQLAKKYKLLEEKQKEMEQRTYTTVAEARIRSQYVDFDDVVNENSIKALRETEPELAASLHANPDIMSKAVATYKAIKKLGLQEVSTAYDTEKALAQKNAAKPRTLTSISPQQGESPLSRANAFANGLTDDLRKHLWKEMQEAAKRS